MAKEAFEKIKAAEDEAARIKAAAAAKVRELTAQTAADGDKKLEEARHEAASQYETRLSAAKAQADEIIARGKRAAEEHAETIISAAKSKLPACVDKILAGITG